MPVLNIDNQVTVTNVANQTLKVTFSGTRLNIMTVSGPIGSPGRDGSGTSNLSLTGSFPIFYDQGSGVVGIVSGYYARFGELTGASGALQAQIVLSSAGVTSLNGLSGALTLAGTGSLFITAQGQRLTISGSGFASLSDIVALSGWAGSTFATTANLASTGQQLFASFTGLSGALAATGSNLQGQTNALTTNLAATGQNLYALITGGSGQALSDYATKIAVTQTGSTLQGRVDLVSGSLIQTGVQLTASLAALSGNLTATGAALSAVKISGSAIVPIADFSGIGGTIVLYSGGKVFISGAGSTAVDHGDGINLSGQLQTTGSYLYRTLTGASGYIITLINAASAGVSSLNGASGVMTLQGAGNVTVTTVGQTITISGNTGDYALFATKIALTQTGADILATVAANLATLTGLSGQAVTDYATKVNLTQSGVQLVGSINSLSGNVTSTGSALYGLVAGMSGQGVIDYATKLSLASTGQQAWTAANVNAIVLSGNLTTTGVTLGSKVDSSSGYSEGIYVHRTGNEIITGTKTFLSEIRFQSGLKTPARFFGSANYTLTSGDFMVIATGAVPSVTGILPAPGDYSGVLFVLKSERTVSTVISGVIDGDINPVLAPNDSLFLYGHSGNWAYIRQTGSRIWADADNNGINLSGSLTQSGLAIAALSGAIATKLAATGAALYQRDIDISGALATLLTATGQTLYGNVVTVSGSLATTGQALYAYITATSGFATGASGALDTRLTQTGVQLIGSLNALSGNLTLTGAALSAVKVTGSAIIPAANFSGIGGTLVIWSGNLVLISGAAAGGGGVSQGQLDALSGYSTGTFATITNLALTGANLQAQINALTGLGTSLAFDIGRNIVVPSGTGSFPVTFSRDLGATAFVIPVMSNNSGDPTIACYPSGATNAGFTLVMSATVPTSGYRLSYLATTGSGYVVLGQSTGNGGVGGILGQVVYTTGNQSADGVKTFNSGIFTGYVGIGTPTPAYSLDVRAAQSPTQFHIASGAIASGGGYLISAGPSNMFMAGGIVYTGKGMWQATDTNYGIIGTDGGDITFWNGTGLINGMSLSPSLKAIIKANGNLGIGTSVPIHGLDVAANIYLRSGEYQPAKDISSNYAIQPTDNRLYFNNAIPIIVTFGDVVTVSGQLVCLKLMNTGSIVVTGTFGQKFDGSDSYLMVGQYSAHEFHSNGANWCIW